MKQIPLRYRLVTETGFGKLYLEPQKVYSIIKQTDILINFSNPETSTQAI